MRRCTPAGWGPASLGACLLAILTVQLAHAGEYVSDDHIDVLLGTRSYEVWVPTGYVAGQRIPLLVVLHGCGQTPRQFAGVARFNQLADRENFLIIYPKQNLLANLLGCWNFQFPFNQARGSGEPASIMQTVNKVKASYSVDASRVYVVGASAGAAMTSILMACYSDVFAAGMVAAGAMYKAATRLIDLGPGAIYGSSYSPDRRGIDAWRCSGSVASRPIPVIVFHGGEDSVAAAVNGEQVIAQFAQTNDLGDDGIDNDSVRSSPTSTARFIGPGRLAYTVREYFYNGKPLLQHYLAPEMGHAWAGGDPDFPFAEPRGPDLTKIMWTFFKQHTRSPAR